MQAERLVWIEYLVVGFLRLCYVFVEGWRETGSDRKGISEEVWERVSGGESEGVESSDKKKEEREEKR